MEKTITRKEEWLQLAQQTKRIVQPEHLQNELKEVIAKHHFPNRKTELWKHTDINRLLETEFLASTYEKLSAEDLKQVAAISVDAYTLVFYNGWFQEHMSQPSDNAEFGFGSLSANMHKEVFQKHSGKSKIFQENIFASMAFSSATDGLFLHVKRNKYIEKPFHIVLVNSSKSKNVMAQMHHFIHLETGAQAHVIVSQVSLNSGSFENNSLEAFVSDNAHLELSLLQNTAQDSYVINTKRIIQEGNAGYKQNTFSFTGSFIRNNTVLDMDGENSNAKFNGLYIPKDKEHFDNYILVNHLKPHCNSDQNYKGIADNQSSAVFLGKVNVARDAQKTNANQSNRNLLLSKQAKISSKPQLEIYADDVACSHGSTTGQLDEEAVFFMQSRGISKDNAIRLLLFAFAADVLEDIKHEEIKSYVDQILHHRFDASK